MEIKSGCGDTFVIPALERQRWANRWGLLPSQPNLLVKCHQCDTPSQRINGGQCLGNDTQGYPLPSTSKHTYTRVNTCPHM